MLLFFLRHADAEDRSGGSPDSQRRLTPKGLDQADKTAKFCARNGLLPEIVLTSPVVRALQTAEIVAKKLGGVETAQCQWLACGMSPSDCIEELRAYSQFTQVFLVGHEPDFGETIAALIGLDDPSGLRIRKSSLCCVEMSALELGKGQLQFLVPVRLM